MTSPLHGEGPGFKSPWAHFLFLDFYICKVYSLSICGNNISNHVAISTYQKIRDLNSIHFIFFHISWCDLFIIIPLSMGKGYKKGLTMALLFGAGLTTTITLYGLGVATLGKTTSLDQFSTIMFLIAGISGFIFGLSQLKLITLKMPSYSRTPKFIQNRGEYSKSYLMGVLLGNAGVGCPNPMFYWLLIYIAGSGSLEIGSSLGLVHGIGRAIPLILFSLLAILGINATKGLTSNRIKIEKITGWMLIFI